MPYSKHPIVLVDDNEETLSLLSLTLKVAGFSDVMTFSMSEAALEFISTHLCDLVVLDIRMPGMSGMTLLKRIKENDPEIPVLMATGVNEMESAIESMKAGAFDYFLKPLDIDRFITSVKHAVSVHRMKRDYDLLAERILDPQLKNPSVFSGIITRDPRMLNICKYVEAIAPSNQPVLVTGETGTGKELIARAIHCASGLKGRFIAVNVAGVDDMVFSDTLFGHTKNAFTGAETARQGMLEMAADGTILLDEIGDLSISSQIKLLRLLQEREYFPLGSDLPKRSNARIIATTSKNLAAFTTSDSFRKDLFFRLRTHYLELPPLRKRKDDLTLLLGHFLNKSAEELKKKPPTVPPEILSLLNTYHFPGNIRELQGMVYDAVSVHEGRVMSLKVFRDRIGQKIDQKPDSSDKSVSPKVRFLHELPTLKEMEDLLIREAMERSNNNQSIAATLLGITHQAISYRLKKRKIDD
jgi:DNA-binding NtrC family response regulator